MLTFHNPRIRAEFSDWPIGGRNTGLCVFEVEYVPKKGYRTIRTTTDQNGNWRTPKKDTFGEKTVIVDGSDNKTYILKSTRHFIYILRHDFMIDSTHFPGDVRYNELKDIIYSVYTE